MPAAVYSTILKASTSQHDAALNKSAQSVYQYKTKCAQAQKSLTNIIGTFTKFAGVLGIAATASEGFKSMMTSNNDLADRYGAAMEGAKTASNEFFYAISKGDFSGLLNGLDSVISRAKDYYNELDNLQTLQLNLIGDNAKLDAELANARKRAREGDKSAAEDIKRISAEQLANVQEEQAAIKREIEARINRDTGLNLGMEQIKHYTRNITELEREVGRLKAEYESLKKKAKEYNRNNVIHYDVKQLEQRYKSYQALLDKYKDGENLDYFNQQYAKYYNLSQRYDELQTRNLRYLKESTKPTTSTTTTTTTHVVTPKLPEYEAGSIADLRAQIAELQRRLENEVLSGGEATTIQSNITALNQQIEMIEESRRPIEKLSSSIEELPTIDGSLIDSDAITAELNAVIDQIETVGLTLDDLANMENLGNSLEQVGDMFQSLSSVMGDESSKIFSAIASSLGSIGSAIAKISALMLAEGATSVMDLPYPANLAALASVVAAVSGVIASIQSVASQNFANGGIVPGATTVGDRITANLNAGEMVLNGRQQRNLFALLNNNTVAASNTERGSVEFVLRGADLYGSFNNYQQKRQRVL